MEITYVQTTQSNLNNVPVINGQVIYTSDTGNQYSDVNSSRKRNVFGDEIESVKDMISDAYDSTHTYNIGDYCIYNDILYKCNTAIATPEAFTPAKWNAKSVMAQIKNMELQNVTPAFTPDSNYIDQYEAYQVGYIVYVRFRTKSVNIPNNTHVFTIDHNFLPIFGMGFPVYIFTSGLIETGGAGFAISDGTNGYVELYGLDSNINQLLVTFSYVIY